MREIRFVGRLRRVGNSLGLFVPASAVRKAGLHEGDTVEAVLRTSIAAPLGLAADVPYTPFDRSELWRDRV